MVVSANAVPTYFILPPTPSIHLHISRHESTIFLIRQAEVGQRKCGSVRQTGGPHGIARTAIDDYRNTDDFRACFSQSFHRR
jgi:hypothetical protein